MHSPYDVMGLIEETARRDSEGFEFKLPANFITWQKTADALRMTLIKLRCDNPEVYQEVVDIIYQETSRDYMAHSR
jgi:hypothetical protein